MLDITMQASQEGRHDVQVAKVLHEVALFCEVVEVSGKLDHLDYIVIRVLFVGCRINAVDERDKVLVGDRELV